MKTVLRVVIFIIALYSLSSTTVLNEYYQLDESTLESYYLNGEITFQQYQLLLDYIKSGEWNIPHGLISFDLQEAFRFNPVIKPLNKRNSKSNTANDLHISYKSRQVYYVNSEVVKPLELYRLGFNYRNNWSGIVELKRNINTPRRFYRRALEYSGNRVVRKLSVGNFSTNIGLGLNIGRRDYYDDKRSDNYNGTDFWHTPSSWYNGVYTGFRLFKLHPWFLYSSKKYVRFEKEKTAAGIEYSGNSNSYGLLASTEKANSYYDGAQLKYRSAGGYFLRDNGNTVFETEIAISPDSGPASCMNFEINNQTFASKISAWSYSSDYINFASSGISDNDEETFYFPNSNTSYRVDTRSRIGFLVKNFVPVDKLISLTNSFTSYTPRFNGTPAYLFATGFDLKNNYYPNIRFNIGAGKQSYYNHPSVVKFSQGHVTTRFSRRSSLFFEYKYVDRKLEDLNKKLKVAGKIQISYYYRISPKLQIAVGAAAKRRVWVYTYADYTEISIQEKLKISRTGHLTIRYIARRGYGSSKAFINLYGEF
ncbi:MAG: hypothetical protein GY855_13815 [candidate division Zixibacteria bacterium]|nr:hypothetical protein [candidate division Zixibacteria bacterium]